VKGICLKAFFTNCVVIRAPRGPAHKFAHKATRGSRMSTPPISNEVQLTEWVATGFPVIVKRGEICVPINNDHKPGTFGLDKRIVGAVPPTPEKQP